MLHALVAEACLREIALKAMLFKEFSVSPICYDFWLLDYNEIKKIGDMSLKVFPKIKGDANFMLIPNAYKCWQFYYCLPLGDCALIFFSYHTLRQCFIF